MTDTPKALSPDALIATTKDGEIELTEQELVRVTGGAGSNNTVNKAMTWSSKDTVAGDLSATVKFKFSS